MNERILSVTALAKVFSYAIYEAKTVLPDDGREYPQMAHHYRGWEITYGIEAIRDWLFSQARR